LCPTRFAFFFFCLRWAAEHGFLGTFGPGLRRLGARQTYISSGRFFLIHLLLFKIRANNLNLWIHSKPYLSLTLLSSCAPPPATCAPTRAAATRSHRGRLLWAPAAAPRVPPRACLLCRGRMLRAPPPACLPATPLLLAPRPPPATPLRLLRRRPCPTPPPATGAGEEAEKNVEIQHFQNTASTFSKYLFNIFKIISSIFLNASSTSTGF